MIHPWYPRDLRYQRLYRALDRALRKPPENLARGIKSLPPVACLPTPWETRALAALLEYRQRKLWGLELIAKHGLLSAAPHVPAEGSVPSAPELSYETRPGWCVRRVEATGESFRARVGQAAPFMSWDDFTVFVTAHKQQPGCSAPILSFSEVEPSLDYELSYDYPSSTPMEVWDREEPEEGMIHLTACDLQDAKVVTTTWSMQFGDPEFLIADEVLERGEKLGLVYAGTAGPRDRLWRMACVGDWRGADAAALELGNPVLVKLTQERDALCQEERLRRIHVQIIRDGGLTPRTLVALDDLGPEHSAAHLAKALSPGHRAVRTAMRIVARRHGPAWFEAVRKLRLRLGSVGELHEDTDLVEACEAFLAKWPTRPSHTACQHTKAAGLGDRAGRAIELG